jgi:type 2A phosphatase activator TIP41
LEVKDAGMWKKKDMSKIKDFKMIEIISDWTYSSPYKGSVRYVSNHIERIKNETSLLLSSNGKGEIRVEASDEAIPVEMLGRENPIIHFGEVYLYEDDLGDQGYVMMSLRFRVMKDCFYVLVRYYLRVDEVIVRIFDTRIFHHFEKNYIIRDF